MRILITGASGLIGSALLDKLRDRNHSIICQSRRAQDGPAGVSWIKHDLITDSWEGACLPELDVVYHLAGQTSSASARRDPIDDLQGNVLALLRLLEYLRSRRRTPFVVLAATATQVGVTDELPIHERLPDRPITFYDIGKLAAEMYLMQYVREGWLQGCSLRFSNVFGGSKSGQQADRGIIDKVFRWAVSGRSIKIYGEGNYLRDYVFIDDVVAALMLAPQCAERTSGRNFYIGSGEEMTLKGAFSRVIALAEAATGRRVPLEHVTPPEDLSDIEYRNAVVDSSAFRDATGWTPRYDFDAGLKAAYGSFRVR